jgi:hypothetical protein
MPTSSSLTSHIGVSGTLHEGSGGRPLDKPNDTPHSRLRLRSPAGLLLLGAALLVLLALVAAVSRTHHVPGGHAGGHAAPVGVGDYVVTIFLVVIVAGAGALLYIWFTEREAIAQTRAARGKKGTYRALAILCVFGLIAVVASRFHFLRSFHLASNSAAKLHPGSHPKSTRKPLPPNVERPPKLEWLPVFVATGAGVAVLGYIGLRTLRRSRGELLESHALERQFESLLDQTLDDLYAQKDPRKAIIAAYARMERLFASAGLERHAYEAPLEYLRRALGEVRASGAALGRLTGLFQRAKFSAHDVDESMRTEAIEALTQVRDELRAKREEDLLHRGRAEAIRNERRDQLGDAEPGDDPFVAAAAKARGSIYSGGRG